MFLVSPMSPQISSHLMYVFLHDHNRLEGVAEEKTYSSDHYQHHFSATVFYLTCYLLGSRREFGNHNEKRNIKKYL